ncbi:hypothetical protein ACFOZY_00550 [Chungangia koreensis]|uniref:DUF1461 domain-containing protein n=1 Tax=Chungangia koreensis TaxID=752657 RepID=A0ABV8X1C6_9LACT
MSPDLISKAKKLLAFLLIASFLVGVSYLIVFKVSFLPNGYDLATVQNDTVSLKSFNLLGFEREIKTQSYSTHDIWKIDDIKYQINRQKEHFWMLFSFTSISLFLFIYKVLNGMKLWKVVLESNIIFAVLLPMIPLIYTLDRITYLIS